MAEQKVIFLDRDGVVNKKALPHEYITTLQEFEFLPGAKDALAKLSRAGYEMYIISNQGGIAKGKMSLQKVEEIHAHMNQELLKEGVVFKGIYICPHRDEDSCDCRKPKPGMLLQAAREHDIDLSLAHFVGDADSDEVAAKAAGVSFIRVPSEVGIAGALSHLLG